MWTCTLGELARWTYETDRLDDRLIVLQRTFVDALQNNSADTNGTEILRRAAELSKRVHWGWEAFIGGELKKYIEQVKTLVRIDDIWSCNPRTKPRPPVFLGT